MVASLRLDINGLTGALSALERLAGRFENLHPLMDQIGAYGEESTVHRFETGVDPQGQAWPESYRAKREGGKTLDDSSRLKGSISHLATADSAEWGTNVIYAGVHQFGRTIRPKDGGRLNFNIPGLGWRSAAEVVMPKREFLGLDADDEAEIGAIVADYIAEALA